MLTDLQKIAFTEHLQGYLRALIADESVAAEIAEVASIALEFGESNDTAEQYPDTWSELGAIACEADVDGTQQRAFPHLEGVARLLDPNDDRINGTDASLPPFVQF